MYGLTLWFVPSLDEQHDHHAETNKWINDRSEQNTGLIIHSHHTVEAFPLMSYSPTCRISAELVERFARRGLRAAVEPAPRLDRTYADATADVARRLARCVLRVSCRQRPLRAPGHLKKLAHRCAACARRFSPLAPNG